MPAYFVERHGSMIIIALGEAIVQIGVGAGADLGRPPVLAGAVLGVLICAAVVDLLRVDRQGQGATGWDLWVGSGAPGAGRLHLPAFSARGRNSFLCPRCRRGNLRNFRPP
jgi:hypothetical protein